MARTDKARENAEGILLQFLLLGDLRWQTLRADGTNTTILGRGMIGEPGLAGVVAGIAVERQANPTALALRSWPKSQKAARNMLNQSNRRLEDLTGQQYIFITQGPYRFQEWVKCDIDRELNEWPLQELLDAGRFLDGIFADEGSAMD
jgi:hypothetical protein